MQQSANLLIATDAMLCGVVFRERGRESVNFYISGSQGETTTEK